MDAKGIEYIAETIANLANVPVRIYEGGEKIFYYSPIDLVVDPITLVEEQVLALDAAVGYLATDDYAYFGQVKTGDTRLVVGPLRDVEPNDLTYHKLAIRLGVAPADVDGFVRGMYSIALMPLYATIQILCVLNFTLTGEKLKVGDIVIHDINQEDLTGDLATEGVAEREFKVHEAAAHNSSSVEATIQNYVRRGRTQELKAYLASMPSFSYGTLSKDELRNEKNLFVVSATLWSRAAIAGGLPEDEALSMSDSYIKRCELLHNQEQIRELGYHMVCALAEKVSRVRIGDDPSDLAIGVANYVQEHLYEPISTEEMAQALFVSRGHLSTAFKRECGMNLADYVQTEKVREAQVLLTHTHQSILDISTHLGYSSQSHFGAVFKRYAGMTPREWRDRR